MLNITKENWQEWAESPVTELFFKYLTDTADESLGDIALTIASGGIYTEVEQTRIAIANATLKMVVETTLDEIEEFYNDRSTDQQSDN